MKDCCKHTKQDKKCIRKSDKKVFSLPRKFSKIKCRKPKGFTMRSSCAPYKDCSQKRTTKRIKRKGGGKKIYKKLYVAGGCFWGIEAKMFNIPDVYKTRVGYMGYNYEGEKPTYEKVSSGKTDFIETVEIKYDPKKISVKELLKKFFTFHDQFSYDKQGNDKGNQYRSAVFYTEDNEMELRDFFKTLKKRTKTALKPKKTFYLAEKYHQKYSSKQYKCKNIKTENRYTFEKVCKNNTDYAEPRGKGKYYKPKYMNKEIKGVYYCSCCEQPLYSSDNAFYSDSGWPAFKESIKGSTIYNSESKEIKCSNCNLHLGHLTKSDKFKDFNHHCINSACLFFKEEKKGGSNKLSYGKNIMNKPLQICSTNPMTGFYRDGKCMTGLEDRGTHTVCAKMNKEFLEYTKDKGNNLYSVVKPGDKWCLCEYRWEQAYNDGKAPKVIKSATNMRTKKSIQKKIKNSLKKKTKKQFLYNPDDPKRSFDVYIDKDPSDTIPIKYTSIQDVKNTIEKLEKLYKSGKYPHKRIWQVGMILMVRLKVLKEKKKTHFRLAERYFKFLKRRTKIVDEKDRKRLKFNI